MDPHELAKAADPVVLGAYLAGLPRAAHAHPGPSESVREDNYKGHEIVVKTTYEVTIDGQMLPLHLSLGKDGSVHCHDLPNYVSGSMIDVLRRIIDVYPDDFAPGEVGSGTSVGAGTRGHGDHATTTGGS